MLSYLKSRVMPMPPEKTFAERSLEVTEQGAVDRAQRQQAEADAEAQAAHQQRLEAYRARQAVAMAMIADYERVAATFDTCLAELVPIVQRMGTLTAQIEHERSLLWADSRAVGDESPGVRFSPKEWLAEVNRVLRQSWQRGQHGT